MKKIIFALSLMLFSSLSQALLITANASVDENKTFTIEYVFEATNVDVQAFDLFFDFDLFENLRFVSNDTIGDWEAFIFPRDDFFGDPATLNFESFGAALTSGEQLTGFIVMIDFIGDTLPEFFQQSFEIYDPFSFEPVDSDQNGLSANIAVESTAINTPSSFLFLLFGFALFVLANSQKSNNKQSIKGQC
jgi:hypothetical protein